MKNAVFAVLVALPIALIGWIVWRGETQAPAEEPIAPAKAGAAPQVKGDGEDATLRALFDGGIAGAEVGESGIEIYNEKSLFDYINGAAPMYLERNFRRLAAAEMAIGEDGELTCDIYDMRTAKDAASIFETERSDTARTVADWPDAIIGNRSFVFHHDRYYVKLTAFDNNAEAQLPALAKALQERM